MKLFAIFLLAGVVTGASIWGYEEDERQGTVGDIFGDMINSTINNVLVKMSDPIQANDTDMTFNDDMISGTVSIAGLSISGIKKLVATMINVDVLHLGINMTVEIPELTVNLNKYSLDVVLGSLVPLYGNGLIVIDINSIRIDIIGNADLTNGIQVSNLTILLGLGSGTFNINGLLDNPELSALVSTALTDNLLDFVNNNAQLISSWIGPFVEDAINKIMNNTSIEMPAGIPKVDDLWFNQMPIEHIEENSFKFA